jgi:hypothetical protein
VTALPGRRRRSTIVGAVAAAVAVAVVITLTIVGALALYNSTDGADASAPRDELVFPNTPVGALAAVDAQGKLASLAVLVVQPAGTGGSVVTVAVNADSGGGPDGAPLPLDQTLAVQGQDAFRSELAAALRLGVEDVAFVDAARLAELLAPAGTLHVDLPVEVADANGDVVATAGASEMDATAAAAVLTSRDAKVSATEQYPAAEAIWSAVAAAVGDGISEAPATTTTGVASTPPASATAAAASDAAVASLFGDLISGRVGTRALRADPVPAEQNPNRADASRLDPAEAVLVFGQIAPGAVSAPGSGLSFRVVSAFSDDQLAGTGLSNTDVAYRTIAIILSNGGNVVSVATNGATPDGPTTLAVSDMTLAAGAEAVKASLGPVEVTLDEHPIAGVDVVAVLGTDALATIGTAPGPGATTATTTETTDG